jgi:hypothetical protein
MKTRGGRSILLGLLAAFLFLTASFFVLKILNRPKLYPLKEVLWVMDERGTYYPPESSCVIESCRRLRECGVDVESPKHEPYVLINAGIKDDSEDIEPVMLLNWHPIMMEQKSPKE